MKLINKNFLLDTQEVAVYIKSNNVVIVMPNHGGAIYGYLGQNQECSYFEPAFSDTVRRARKTWLPFRVDINIADWRALQKEYGEGVAAHHILERIVRP